MVSGTSIVIVGHATSSQLCQSTFALQWPQAKDVEMKTWRLSEIQTVHALDMPFSRATTLGRQDLQTELTGDQKGHRPTRALNSLTTPENLWSEISCVR